MLPAVSSCLPREIAEQEKTSGRLTIGKNTRTRRKETGAAVTRLARQTESMREGCETKPSPICLNALLRRVCSRTNLQSQARSRTLREEIETYRYNIETALLKRPSVSLYARFYSRDINFNGIVSLLVN